MNLASTKALNMIKPSHFRYSKNDLIRTPNIRFLYQEGLTVDKKYSSEKLFSM